MITKQDYQLVTKQLKTQKLINIGLAVGLVTLSSFFGLSINNNQPSIMSFEEISVERINIVEKNGLNRMVLANSDKAPGAVKDVFKTDPRPGMIFYNDEGTENGGLTFKGSKHGDDVNHYLDLSFDRYNQGQTLMMHHGEYSDYMLTGLTVKDRPSSPIDFEMQKRFMHAHASGDKATMAEIQQYMTDNNLLGANRAFYGTVNGDARLQLHDVDGKVRIQMAVTKSGEAKLDFLNDKGKVIARFPKQITEIK